MVAGGGDGTANAVAGKLAGTDAALGVPPMGTLNPLPEMSVSRSTSKPPSAISSPVIKKVDVAEVNGRVFVSNSGVGFYPHFVRKSEATRPRQARGVHACCAVETEVLGLRLWSRLGADRLLPTNRKGVTLLNTSARSKWTFT